MKKALVVTRPCRSRFRRLGSRCRGLAAVARAASRTACPEGNRPAQGVAEGGAETALASQGHRLWLLDARSGRRTSLPAEQQGAEDEFVQALQVRDGKRVWSQRLGKVGPNQRANYPGARTTPTVEGERLYALGSDGDLACLDMAKGNVLWKKHLRSDFGGKPGCGPTPNRR